MADDKNHPLRELCYLASIEENPDKLLELVQEINRLVEERLKVSGEGEVDKTQSDLSHRATAGK